MLIYNRKPRICIALPGINYQPFIPYILSTLPIVTYLTEQFDVTLVFRKVLTTKGLNHPYLSILDSSQLSLQEAKNTNSYFTPSDFITTWNYQNIIKKFAQQHAHDFDLVIEVEWPLLGLFSRAFQQQGVPTVAMVEAEYQYPQPRLSFRRQPGKQWIKQVASIGFPRVRAQLRRHWLRQANSIITETPQMQQFLLGNSYISPATPVYPIPMGVNPQIFFPRDRADCRQSLEIAPNTLMMVYVGSLNCFIQEPRPIIEALGRERPTNVTLHIIGDGHQRQNLQTLAQSCQAPVIFHGRTSQTEASLYIGAADLCIAPYNQNIYSGGELTSATLKIPEYLACGRPVLTIPCSRMKTLLNQERYGFLVENQIESYQSFLQQHLNLSALRHKESIVLLDLEAGILQRQRILLTFADIAELYSEVIHNSLVQSDNYIVA